jgi:transcription elongation GreA/GreB family factor
MTATQRKTALRAQLLETMAASLATARQAHKSAVVGATHGVARQENDKDTRGLEQSYVARGQALRIAELEAEIAEVRAMAVTPTASISPGSLVTVESDEASRTYFVAPHGGGAQLERGTVVVVTPRSALGQGLVGKGVGDECELVLQGKKRTLEIVSVT